MKYCAHCCKEVLDEAVICPNCGCSVQDAPRQQQQQQYYAPQPQQDSYTPLCIIGFIFSFFGGIVGLILSILAYKNAKETGNAKSMTLSKAGIIISAVLLGIEFIGGFILGLLDVNLFLYLFNY
ncbi:MAG: hypothetical protein K2N47_04735 [Clostridia bacterium]|nr:hypothetical protein [Clostridia bacterium]